MIVTTSNNIEGHRIVGYKGVVTGEAIIGANIFKDFFASITDVIGGRSSSYERSLRKAREIALREMEEAAHRNGGNAVIGVDLDYETIGKGGSMLMVSASGTAVEIELFNKL